MTFGASNNGSSFRSVFGIGRKLLEASTYLSILNPEPWDYDNFPILLKEQGYTNKVAFSVYLNDANSTSGSVLFGGYDKAKFHGDLVKLPITNYNASNVDLQSVTYNGKQIHFGEPNSVTLDTGATISYLPPDTLDAIGEAIGGQKEETLIGNVYTVSCSQLKGKSFSFNFNGVSIDVPFESLLAASTDGSDNCALNIFPNKDLAALGDNFLRYAYALYDYEDDTISLAQAKYTTESEIVNL